MYTFKVIDNETGKEPDYEKIALTEEWAKHLIYCDIDTFAIKEDGGLILLDDCGNCAFCPTDRYTIVEDVKHGRWHIMPEDPYDESDTPTEEGWYRIITDDGEEMTDYFFGKPTFTGMGCVYWKNCKKIIRAWAKMDGKENNHETN